MREKDRRDDAFIFGISIIPSDCTFLHSLRSEVAFVQPIEPTPGFLENIRGNAYV
jgi:hypothetical protein